MIYRLLVFNALAGLLQAQTSITLTTSPNPSVFGAPVTLTASLTPANATGKVTFYDGVTVLGAKPLVSGVARLATVMLPAGNRKLKAYYAGDGTVPAATSNVVSQVINAQPAAYLYESPVTGAFGPVIGVADFNGDGKPDIAIATQVSDVSTVSILLGDGAGGFSKAFDYTSQTVVDTATVGDFNGDGLPDLAFITQHSSASMVILLGNGDGTFSPLISPYPLSNASLAAAESMAAADFNGDGNTDLVVASSNFGLKILLGKGDGTFQTAASYVTNPSSTNGGQSGFAAVGDFNGDGKPDLAITEEPGNAGNDMKVLLGNGDGTFQPPSVVASNLTLAYGNTLAVGDFNGDGKLDLATQNGDVLLGNGDGTFQKLVHYPTGCVTGCSGVSIAVLDLNGDGKADLAIANASRQNLSILLGNGDGSFQPAIQTHVTYSISGLFVADFNGDGKSDIAAYLAQEATVYYGTNLTVTATGGTPQSTIITKAFPVPLQVTVKDGTKPLAGVPVIFVAPANGASATFSSNPAITDANGVASVTATANSVVGTYTVTAGSGFTTTFSLSNVSPAAAVIAATGGTPQSTTSGTPFPAALQVTLTDSSGLPASGVTVTFTAPSSGASALLSAGTAVTNGAGVASVTATANNAGGSYLVTASAGGLSTTFALTNLGVAQITPSSPVQQSTLLGTYFAKPLQVTVTNSSGAPAAGVTVTFSAPASGAFAGFTAPAAVTNASGVASTLAIANYVAGSYTVTASVQGLSATFSLTNLAVVPVTVTLTTSANPSALGTPVTLTASIPNPAGAGNGLVTFYDGGNLLGTATASGGVASYSTIVLSAGTHKLTAYYRDQTNAQIGTSSAVNQAVKAAAGGAFTAANPLPLGQNVTTGVSGDFNGDGKMDVALAANGSLVVLLGKGDGSFQTPLISTPTGGINTLLTGDFNGDGKTDLVVGLSTAVAVLLGNGDGTFRLGGVVSEGLVAAGDFNGDGREDLITFITQVTYIPQPEAVGPKPHEGGPIYITVLHFFPGNGDGTFGAPVTLGNTFPGSVATVADFNGDGKPDLASWTFGGPAILLGNGDGTFHSPASSGTPSSDAPVLYPTTFLVPGDFNGDGKTDLAIGGIPQTGFPGAQIATTYIQLGNGDGTFQPAVSYPLGMAVSASDFNGDGFIDLAVTDTAGNLSGVLLNAGDGTFPLKIPISVGAPLAVADFNGDGKADLFTVNPSGSVGATATVLLGTTTNPPGSPASLTAAAGTPQSTPIQTAFPSPLQVTVTDANGRPVSGVTVVFFAPPTGAGAILSSGTAVTNSAGAAAITAVANQTLGSYQVTASVGSLSATFSLTNLPPQGSTNLARGKLATQSSTLSYFSAGATSAVDGNTNGNFFFGSVTATNADPNAWWQVDLGASTAVTSVLIFNRTDCCGSRLGDYWVFVSDTPFLATDTPAALQSRPGTFASHQTTAPNPSTIIPMTAQGRYVRVQLSGTDYLSLAEVQVFGAGGTPPPSELAHGKSATQSSTLPGAPTAAAGSAVDGNPNGSFYAGSVTATNLDANPWWQVDLGASASVASVTVWNRTDCCGDRMTDYWLFVSDTPFLASDTPATLQSRAGTFASHQTSAPNPSISIPVNAPGRYVRVQLSSANYLSLAEVQVFGSGGIPASNLAQGKAATQSCTLAGAPTAAAGSAVDGNPDGNFYDGSVTATNADTNAWWQVDLGTSAAVSSVTISNRTDCCGTRLSDYWVFVSDTPFLPADTPATLQNRAGTFASHQTAAPNPSTSVPVAAHGRYVRVQLSGTDYLSLAEVQVFGQ